MKVAYLILAHHSPHHLSRLLKALDSENSRFFIHLDKKADIRPFQQALRSPRIIFIKKRVSIFWGEFSMVQATLHLMEEALACSESIDYLCTLSGACYPLRSPHYIEKFFIKHNKTEFINVMEMPQRNKSLDRLQLYRINTFNENIFVRKCCRIVNDVIARKKLFKRDHQKYLGSLKPYAGSQWWAMTAEAARYILSFCASNPSLVRFFKNTTVPDESFFQTIIGNSKFSTKIKPNLTYTDWSIAPFSSPAFIAQRHIDIFKKQGDREFLFARKFTDDSQELTQTIDKEIIAAYEA